MSLEQSLALENRALREHNEELREKVLLLESMFETKYDLPVAWRLTKQQSRMFVVLMANRIVTPGQMLDAMNYWPGSEMLDSNSLHVQVFNLRRKIEPFGVFIDNVRGIGFSLRSPVKDAPLPSIRVAEPDIRYGAAVYLPGGGQ